MGSNVISIQKIRKSNVTLQRRRHLFLREEQERRIARICGDGTPSKSVVEAHLNYV